MKLKTKTVAFLILLLLPFTMCYGQENNNWKERLLQHEKDFEVIKREHTKMYKMISKLFIEKFSYQGYYDLMTEENEEKEERENPN